MPGFDRSTPGAATSLLDVADVMAEFIRVVAGGRAAVIGESFGGGVAAWLAIRHPAVVSRLVLAAPAGLGQEGGSLLGLSPAEMAVILHGQAPTLVLWEIADQMIWPSQARYFVEAIPNARLVIIEGAPHVLSAAVPLEFLTAVLAFLSESDRARTEATSSAVSRIAVDGPYLSAATCWSMRSRAGSESQPPGC